MPAENLDPTPPQPDQPDDWELLARQAAGEWNHEHPGVAALYQNHVVPHLQQRGLAHLAISEQDKAGARLLHQRDPSTHHSDEIEAVTDYLRQNGEKIPNEPDTKIATYLDFMSEVVGDGILTGDQESIDRQVELCVSPDETFTDRYFQAKAEAEAKGLLGIRPDQTTQYLAEDTRVELKKLAGQVYQSYDMRDPRNGKTGREQIIHAAQADQRARLNQWAEYVVGDGHYPNWFRKYAWDSVTKLSNIDKQKREFMKRSSGTVANYPELNREALAYVLDGLSKIHLRGESVEGDENLQKLLKGANFAKLYGHAVMETAADNAELLKSIEGKWVKFDQSTDPRVARRLSESLQGHGTGWCVAGEETAGSYLSQGEGYIFYTQDLKGGFSVPRLAIFMQDGKVSHETRGILPGQEVEPELVDTMAEKLQTLPGGEERLQTASDMKQLSAIDDLLSKNPSAELSAEDIAFLYELDHAITSFGYDDDPRVKKLQLKVASRHVADMLENSGAPAELVGRMRSHVRVHELIQIASGHPEAEFSDDDLCFIYGLYGPVDTLNPEEDYELGRTIDYHHDGRDRERLIQLMPEALAEQYKTSMKAYQETARTLGIEATDEATLEREFAAKLSTWQEQGVYQYILEHLIERDTQFSLVMTPNVTVSYSQLKTAVGTFGESQPHPTYIRDDLISQYTAEELSGAVDDGVAVRLSLMPNKPTTALGVVPVEEQRGKLQRLREQLPKLSLRVPSLLDGLSYWQTLKAHGSALVGDGVFEKTRIRHLDLPPKRFDGWLAVPYSSVYDSGRPCFGDSGAVLGDVARVSVG